MQGTIPELLIVIYKTMPFHQRGRPDLPLLTRQPLGIRNDMVDVWIMLARGILGGITLTSA